MSSKSTFAFIDPTSLTTDLRVQRPLDLVRVAELASSFDPSRLGTIVVSQRADGTIVVLDGQTRLAAQAKAGHKAAVHAEVHTGLSLQDEAAMFLAYNNSKPVSALDKFLVRVTEGDPTAVAINNIITAHGWRVVKGGLDASIQAVNALERVYTKGGANGAQIVGAIMDSITKAWGYDFAGTNASLIGGLGELFLRYGDKVDRAKLVREMQSTNPRTLLGRARGMKEARVFNDSLPVVVGRVLHTIHNQKMRRNQLPDWK